jgi:UDP-glucose 4-epimerase
MCKILIVGSEGFIGSNLIRYYQSNNIDVVGCDIKDAIIGNYEYINYNELGNFSLIPFEDFQFCINASGSGNVQLSFDNPIIDFTSNVSMVFELLNGIKNRNTSCKYIHISSAAVYGNPDKLPIPEESLPNPVSPYGFSKLLSELICTEFSDIFKIPILRLRPFSIYGPGLKKQLFWDLYQKYNSECKDLSLFGTGKESRDFIYISDFIEALECIRIGGSYENEIYNVASGIETKIEEVAKKFNEEFGSLKNVKFSKEKKIGDPQNWLADIKKLESKGFKPKISIHKGISNTIKWYKSLS